MQELISFLTVILVFRLFSVFLFHNQDFLRKFSRFFFMLLSSWYTSLCRVSLFCLYRWVRAFLTRPLPIILPPLLCPAHKYKSQPWLIRSMPSEEPVVCLTNPNARVSHRVQSGPGPPLFVSLSSKRQQFQESITSSHEHYFTSILGRIRFFLYLYR